MTEKSEEMRGTVEELERNVDLSALLQPAAPAAPQYMVCRQTGVPVVTTFRAAGQGFVWCDYCRRRRPEDDAHEVKTVTVFRTGEL